jgi:hypothetical protein
MSNEPAATATAHGNRYAVQIEGATLEFNSTGDYAFVVVADQGYGWKVQMRTNSAAAARAKVGRQTALGAHVRAAIVPVAHS